MQKSITYGTISVDMFNKVTTLTEFLLTEERKIENTTGSFTLLLTQIENAAKIIASHVKRTGLVDIIGETGKMNAYDEKVQKLDEFANEILIDMLTASKQVSTLGSEELDEFIEVKNGGDYMVMFDPLDGSSNIDVNAPIGTIFSIYRKSNSLPLGKNQIAAGYILYGPRFQLRAELPVKSLFVQGRTLF
jgi:fructose-1,6-bisphosphatase I